MFPVRDHARPALREDRPLTIAATTTDRPRFGIPMRSCLGGPKSADLRSNANARLVTRPPALESAHNGSGLHTPGANDAGGSRQVTTAATGKTVNVGVNANEPLPSRLLASADPGEPAHEPVAGPLKTPALEDSKRATEQRLATVAVRKSQ